MQQQKIKLEKQLSQVAGAEIEVTIRGGKNFTFSTEEMNVAAAEKVVKFFDGHGKITVEHDAECGSFIYIDA